MNRVEGLARASSTRKANFATCWVGTEIFVAPNRNDANEIIRNNEIRTSPSSPRDVDDNPNNNRAKIHLARTLATTTADHLNDFVVKLRILKIPRILTSSDIFHSHIQHITADFRDHQHQYL